MYLIMGSRALIMKETDSEIKKLAILKLDP